jgi:hypothetical protein
MEKCNVLNWLNEVKERSSKATKGPWWFVLGGLIWAGESKLLAQISGQAPQRDSDMDFIAHSRTDIDKLAGMLKKCVEYIDSQCMKCTAPNKQWGCSHCPTHIIKVELNKMAGER